MSYGTPPYAETPYAGLLETSSTPPAGPTGDYPSIQILFSPTTGPYETAVWTDITTYVRARTPIRIRRGRDHALDQFTTGTCTFELDNRTRAFDPSYTAGPFHGGLGPNRLVQVRAVWQSVTYYLFTGLIDGLEQRYDRSDRDATVRVTCSDLFKILGRPGFRPAYPWVLDSGAQSALDSGRVLADTTPAMFRERSGTRVERLLGLVGVQASRMDIDAGRSVLHDDPFDDDSVLAHLQRVARTESGRLFVEGDGTVRFQDRSAYRTVPALASSQITLGDTDTYAGQYQDLRFDPSDQRLVRNDVSRGRARYRPAVVRDESSIGLYGLASDQGDDLLYADRREAADAARYIVDRYSDPEARIDRVILAPRRQPSVLWPAVLGSEIGTRVTVERTPMQLGTVFSQVSHVESVEHSIDWDRQGWVTSWSLSAADLSAYWRLDATDGSSLLDAGLVLAY